MSVLGTRSDPRSAPSAPPTQKSSKASTFLSTLKGESSRYKYKRYTGLPLRYAGGKSLAVGHIIERIPNDIEHLIAPFFGGGSVEIACAKELGINVKGYDVFDILVNYWQLQLSTPHELAHRLRALSPTKKQYKTIKERLYKHWNREQLIDKPLELATHYWFNHNLSYGPGFLGWMSSIYEEQERYSRLVDKVAHFSCTNLEIKCSSFEETLPAHKNDFLYCDPPYYLEGDSKMFRGIYPQRNFPVHHKGFNHELLRRLLHKHKGGFLLSYNDCAAVRAWYKDFKIEEVEWQYTLGQGETRIGQNRINNQSGHIKRSHELIISNV